LPFIETIARNAEFPRDLGRGRCPMSHLRGGLIVPPFEVSVKPGPVQESFKVTQFPPAFRGGNTAWPWR
jgi:hypothetical protein